MLIPQSGYVLSEIHLKETLNNNVGPLSRSSCKHLIFTLSYHKQKCFLVLGVIWGMLLYRHLLTLSSFLFPTAAPQALSSVWLCFCPRDLLDSEHTDGYLFPQLNIDKLFWEREKREMVEVQMQKSCIFSFSFFIKAIIVPRWFSQIFSWILSFVFVS